MTMVAGTISPKQALPSSKPKMQTSLMMSAAQLGLSAQDVADVISYLKQPQK
jgi:hypothetical protein